MAPIRKHITEFLITDSLDLSEILLGLAKLIMGIVILLSPFHVYTDGVVSHVPAILTGLLCLGAGTSKLWAWFTKNTKLRRLHGLLGVMVWIFVGVLELFHTTHIALLLFFVLFALTDIVVFIRLRLTDDH